MATQKTWLHAKINTKADLIMTINKKSSNFLFCVLPANAAYTLISTGLISLSFIPGMDKIRTEGLCSISQLH